MNEMTNNVFRVKTVNKDIVRQIIKNHKGITKKEVAYATGLSVATCGSILNEFVTSEEVFEGELKNSSGGRAARVYYYNGDFSQCTIMSALVDGDDVIFKYSIVNRSGQIKDTVSKKCECINLEYIIGEASKLFEEYCNIKSLAVSVPGIVQEGKILDCDEKHLVGVDLKQELEDRFNVCVTVETEPRATLYGYYKQVQNTDDSFAIITAARNQRLGSGFISNGRFVRGMNGMAGEIQPLIPTYDDTKKDSNYNNEELAYVIKAIISILNPSEILLTGKLFPVDIAKRIYEQCNCFIPTRFMPKISFLDNSEEYLQKGLIELALEKVEGEMKLIHV